jgi:hypothetical protein
MASEPPIPPRLYLNEHLSPDLAEALRQRGFDVIASLEVDMGEREDEEHLVFAAQQGRAVLTFNVQDFMPLHEQFLAAGREHAGIVFSTEESFRVLFRRLIRLLHSVAAQELRNQVRWLNEFK